MGRLTENGVVNVKNKSYSVTAEVVVPTGGADGRDHRPGRAFGGWSLYLKDGKPKYCYNLFGVQMYLRRRRDAPVPAGTHQVRMEFAYDGGGVGKGGAVALYSTGARSASGRVEETQPMIFSADETTATSAGHRHAGERDYEIEDSALHRNGQLGADRHGEVEDSTTT